MQLFYDYTFYKVLAGTTLIGISTGILGCFTVLRKQSLLGDTIAHATFPGLTGMFLIVLQKSYALLLLGATISGLLGTYFVHVITKHTTLKKDTALGIVLSGFFGLGTIFLTIIQKNPFAHQAGIDKFLFGHASTLLVHDVYILAGITTIVLFTVTCFWKELKIFSFDSTYAQTIGMPIEWINIILMILIVLTIIVGLQTVGLILISSFLISPATAAKQWTHSLLSMTILSVLFSLFATIAGTCISCSVQAVPTGPIIVVISTCVTFISFIFAPQGLVTKWLIAHRQKKNMQLATMLKNFMLFNESKTDPFHPHDLQALQVIGKKGTNTTLKLLQRQGFIQNTHDNFWQLTPKGLSQAKRLLARRHQCL